MGLFPSPDHQTQELTGGGLDLLKKRVRCDETLGSQDRTYVPRGLEAGVRGRDSSVALSFGTVRWRSVRSVTFGFGAVRWGDVRSVAFGFGTVRWGNVRSVTFDFGTVRRGNVRSGRVRPGRVRGPRSVVDLLVVCCDIRSEELQFRLVGVGRRRTGRLSQVDSMTINGDGYASS